MQAVETTPIESFIQREYNQQTNGKPSIEQIKKAASEVFCVEVSDLISYKRPTELKEARHVALVIIYYVHGYSLSRTGCSLGGHRFDHATVLHAVRNVKNDYALYPPFRKKVNDVLRRLQIESIADMYLKDW